MSDHHHDNQPSSHHQSAQHHAHEHHTHVHGPLDHPSHQTQSDFFDSAAAGWDEKPFNVASSKNVIAALRKELPQLGEVAAVKKDLSVLDVGCGTGLLSVLLAPSVQSIMAVDPSSGMVAALQTKIDAEPSLANIRPVCALLEDPDDVRLQDENGRPRKFDLVVSHMVLHHVPSISAFLALLFETLLPGGCVALTDFEDTGLESTKFHSESVHVHVKRHGIERGEIERELGRAGFVDVRVKKIFRMEKEVEGGEDMTFNFLMCYGKKP